jgi:hypothetical protein
VQQSAGDMPFLSLQSNIKTGLLRGQVAATRLIEEPNKIIGYLKLKSYKISNKKITKLWRFG